MAQVMRGSRVAAEKLHLPEPMTPPGEVAGMSFAPQAELVFVEDEFAPAGRRQTSLGQVSDFLSVQHLAGVNATFMRTLHII
jgi:hypothetical protein